MSEPTPQPHSFQVEMAPIFGIMPKNIWYFDQYYISEQSGDLPRIYFRRSRDAKIVFACDLQISEFVFSKPQLSNYLKEREKHLGENVLRDHDKCKCKLNNEELGDEIDVGLVNTLTITTAGITTPLLARAELFFGYFSIKVLNDAFIARATKIVAPVFPVALLRASPCTDFFLVNDLVKII